MPDKLSLEFLSLRKKIMEADFSSMNDRQLEAVLSTDGPLLVLAGAGSGKTTVLVNRIACILKYGRAYYSNYVPDTLSADDLSYLKNCLETRCFSQDRLKELLSVDAPPAWSILAITFTNKAAGEMKDRLSRMLGAQAGEIWAFTFHSACCRILRRDIENLDLGYTRSFTIYDTDDSIRLLKESCHDIAGDDRSFISKTLLPSISRAKEKNLDPKAFEAASQGDFRMKKVSAAYYRYQEALRRANALDFDDMLRLTVKLFEKCPDVLEYYQRRFKYILVDEYQDTNHVQYKLVSLLASRHRNLCVVGDDDQSIYKFRGATIENILSFESQFQNAKVVKLEQNYRSTSVILDAANAVISNNSVRKGKNLWTEKKNGDLIDVQCFDDESGESQYIAQTILENVKKGMKFSDHAVLYRMNAQSGSIEKAFVKQGVPYRILSGYRLYDRLEIRDILAYLKVINNTRDDVSMARIVNVPKRGIGEATVSAAQEIAETEGISLYDVFLHSRDYAYFSKKSSRIDGLMKFLEEMRGLTDQIPVQEFIKGVIVKSGYLAALEADNSNESKDRIENLGALISSAAEFDKETGGTLQEFLEEAALMADIDNYDSSADTVTMMTIHSAKGLEFPSVFIAGIEEGVFPGQNSAFYPEELEEERRLAYVGITRAKESLHLTYARVRLLFGSTVYHRPSRFIEEIPPELKKLTDNRPKYEVRAMRAPAKTAAPAPGKLGVSQQKKETAVYLVGDMVSHNTFGNGMVLSVRPMGGDTLVEIAFDRFGTKKLMANFAKLKKL